MGSPIPHALCALSATEGGTIFCAEGNPLKIGKTIWRLKRNKIFLAILLMLAPAIPRSVCAQTLSYTDKLGRKIDLAVPARRAVILQLYEFLPALHCWDRVAGVGRYAYQNDLVIAALPDISTRIPSVGSGSDLNTEALLKLKPDVVVTWTYKPENIQFMQAKGLKVIVVYPDTLPELYDLVRLQGRIFQREAQAQNTITQMDEIIRLVQARSSRIPSDRRKKVLWLYGRENEVAGDADLTGNLLNLIGGRNVAGSFPQRTADVSIETIIGWNPDVIFIWGNARFNAQNLLSSPQWRHVKAVREGQVFKLPEWSIWSPRLAPIALWMAIKTYPDLYRDVDLMATTDRFYRKVFGFPLRKAPTGF